MRIEDGVDYFSYTLKDTARCRYAFCQTSYRPSPTMRCRSTDDCGYPVDRQYGQMTSPEQASSRAATLDAIQPSLQDGQDPKSSSPGGHDAGPSRAVPPSVSDLDPESYGLIERSLVRKADWAIL